MNGYGPLLDFNREVTRFDVAGHKLQLLADYYGVTRDKDGLKELRPKWDPVISLIRESRKTDNGFLPKDRYAGDINEQVYSPQLERSKLARSARYGRRSR